MKPSDEALGFLTPKQAAEYLRRISGRGSEKTLSGLRYYGGGPVFHVIGTRTIGYLPADLEAWVRSRLSGPKRIGGKGDATPAEPPILPTAPAPTDGWGSTLPPRR